MKMNMELETLRRELDRIDDEMVRLFAERMNTVKSVAGAKRQSGGAVYNPAREQEIIRRVRGLVADELADYTADLMSTLFELSRAYQRELLSAETNPAAAECRNGE